ncbi:MAG: hypothetical protein HY903_03585 [Deltaproteobacteria bacterium]|nr:hypothetical protein [Deltaproteobacteria bacterium]
MASRKPSRRKVWRVMTESGILQIYAEAVVQGTMTMDEARKRSQAYKAAWQDTPHGTHKAGKE